MIHIPKAICAEMIAHAAAEAPNECCGLLAGAAGTVRAIYQIRNLPSEDPAITELEVPPDRRLRYVMDPREQIRAFKEMREAGTELAAIYHSHPHSPAYPSATDVRLAFYPEVYYLIISLAKGAPEIRAFRIIDGKISEEKIQISA